MGWGLYGMVRRLGLLPEPASLICAFMVLSYGVLTGMSASTMRAVVMFLTAMGAEYFGRSYDMLCGLSLAALVLFIRQPLLITQSGVQFSFSAVLSLGVLWPAICRLLPEDLMSKPLVQSAGACGAACLATLPLTAISYGEIPVLAIPVNLIVLPMISLLVPLAALTGGIGLLSLAAATFPGGSVRALLWLCTTICRLGRRCPLAVWRTGHPPAWTICLYYLLLTLFVVKSYRYSVQNVKEERKASEEPKAQLERREQQSQLPGQKSQNGCKLLGLLLAALFLLLIPFRRYGSFVWFLDVGQGDCMVLRTGKNVWMFDGGSSDLDQVGEYRLSPFLDYYGEEKVDYAFVSHGDADHYSGIEELMAIGRVGHLAVGEASRNDAGIKKLIKLADAGGIPVIFLKAGDEWRDADWHFNCLYPAEEEKGFADTNDRSLVIRADWENTSFMITGDISSEVETELLARYPGSMIRNTHDNKTGKRAEDEGDGESIVEGSFLQDIDILKCPHHGSRFSSSNAFLQSMQPGITIISCGKDNRYGHPAQETLERLEKAGSTVYCTKDSGSICIQHRSRNIIVRQFKQP